MNTIVCEISDRIYDTIEDYGGFHFCYNFFTSCFLYFRHLDFRIQLIVSQFLAFPLTFNGLNLLNHDGFHLVFCKYIF